MTADRATVPAGLAWHGETPLVTFVSIAMADLDLAFLDDAIARGRISHFTPLDAFDFDDRDLGLAGAIHHMTRCGSTLVRRQLDALPGITALSEPFVFQMVLEGPAAPVAVTRRRIRQLVAAWRDAMPGRLVIKWPSLLGQHAATLADALPEVPMIFLHRDAVEVLASIAADSLGGLSHVRPRHAVEDGRPLPTDTLELWATVLARTCRMAAGAPNLRTVDYAGLPEAGWTQIAPYFGLAEDRAGMRAASLLHSKHRRPFVPDGPARRAAGDAHLRHLAATILAPALADLRARTPALPASPDLAHGPAGVMGN